MNRLIYIVIFTCLLLQISIKTSAQYADVGCKNNERGLEIVQIDNTDSSTIIHIKCTNNGNKYISVNENSVLKDRTTNRIHKLLNSYNLPISNEGENKYMVFDSNIQNHFFSLEYERLPDTVNEFDLIGGTDLLHGFNIYGISFNKINKKTPIDIDNFISYSPVKEYGSYFENGNSIHYYRHNGLYISVSLSLNTEFGKFYAPNVAIYNATGRSVLFNPSSISATAFNSNKNKSQSMEILSYEEYMKKVKTKQMWSGVFYKLNENIAASDAGHSTSNTEYYNHEHEKATETRSKEYGRRRDQKNNTYSKNTSTYDYKSHGTSRTDTYDGAAAYDAQQNAERKIDEYMQNQERVKEQISSEYLKSNTIKDGTEYAGYFNIKYCKATTITIDIPINGTTYTFTINCAR